MSPCSQIGELQEALSVMCLAEAGNHIYILIMSSVLSINQGCFHIDQPKHSIIFLAKGAGPGRCTEDRENADEFFID